MPKKVSPGGLGPKTPSKTPFGGDFGAILGILGGQVGGQNLIFLSTWLNVCFANNKPAITAFWFETNLADIAVKTEYQNLSFIGGGQDDIEFKKLKGFKQWRENMETMSLIDKKIDNWLKG